MKKEKKNQRNTSFAGNPIPTNEKEHLKEHFFSISVADAEGTGTYKQTSSMKLSDSVHFLLLAKKSICSNKTIVCRKKVSNHKDKDVPYSFGSIGP